jgi:hypothetical protein
MLFEKSNSCLFDRIVQNIQIWNVDKIQTIRRLNLAFETSTPGVWPTMLQGAERGASSLPLFPLTK